VIVEDRLTDGGTVVVTPTVPVTPTPVAPAGPPRVWPYVVGGVLLWVASIALVVWWLKPVAPPGPQPSPAPVVDHDPAFVPVGKALADQFGKDYAAAVADGRKMLDAGQSRTMAYDAIAKAFSDNRQKSFDAIADPAISKVSPTADDAAMTPAERTALSKALGGLEKGAGGK
jgi:hypothetical protein